MSVLRTRWGGIELVSAGAGEVFVLLHGLQSSASVWDGVLEHLSGVRSLAVNFPGRGGSARWAPEFGPIPSYYTVDTFTRVLRAVVESVGREVSIVGWSMGAMVALHYVATYGDAGVSRLFLCSGATRVAGRVSTFAATSFEELEREIEQRSRKASLPAAADPLAVAYTWLSMSNFDLRGRLAQVRVPTTVIHGTLDKECPFEEAEIMAAEIFSARLVPLPECGHFILREAPGTVARAIQCTL